MHADLATEWDLEDLAEDISEGPELPFEAFYDAEKKEYYILNQGGRWLRQNATQLFRRLRNAGITEQAEKGRIAQHFEDHFDVHYAAPLAGKPTGFYEDNGKRILVTDSPKFIDPVEGDWSNLRDVLEGLLLDSEEEHGHMQWNTFNGWMKVGVEALQAGRYQDGQALAIAGERDCGKSLLQHLITPLLGGRSAKGGRYMMGKTEFNAELFEAEHIILEDEIGSHSITDRLRLGTSIKEFTVSTQSLSCHRKGRTAINLRPWWRVTITLNDDPEALRVLPPLDGHIEDKLILLRASRFDLPMDTHTSELREAFGNRLRSELPAYLYWLLNEFTIEDNLAHRRFGIQTWHHPALRQELSDLSPEVQLLDLIDEALFDNWTSPSTEWQGTASELRRELVQSPTTKSDAERLLNWQNAPGTYLGRLATQLPDRVESHRTSTQRLWIIRRADDGMTNNPELE